MPHGAQGEVPDEHGSHELEAESIGRYLSQQRRLRGISIEQLAESTRIPRRSLERLESGHFDHDIDGFVRGFVRTVAAGLGLDPEDTLARMLAEPRAHSDSGHTIPNWLGRGLVGLVALVLLVMAFGVVRAVWQAGGHSEPPTAGAVVVWRSDPVRALAEAHAAGSGASDPSLVTRTGTANVSAGTRAGSASVASAEPEGARGASSAARAGTGGALPAARGGTPDEAPGREPAAE